MPVFISYSHQDKRFVDLFAAQLVLHKVHVWLDRWEMHVGDSIIDKIQDAIEGTSALIVILSSASVKSEWCKKELSSGLLRELEERKVLVLPALIQDCKIPLFLRGKLYADFRNNFDEGLKTVLEAIAKVTSNTLGRVDEPEYHIDWGTLKRRSTLRLTMVEQTIDQPYTVLNEIYIVADAVGTREYKKVLPEQREFANYKIISLLTKEISEKLDFKVLLENALPKEYSNKFIDLKSGAEYSYLITARRLGQDTGRDILFRVGDQVANIKRQLYEVNKPSSDSWGDRIF